MSVAEKNNLRLYILDISGYTRFLVNTDLVHAKATITDILNSLYEYANKDLVLNKIEGDAMFFYSSVLNRDELHNLSIDIYEHYKNTILTSLAAKHSQCPFALCRHTHDLSIKFFIHEGEVAHHNVSEFKELIGRPVIEIHRVLKNSVKNESYILNIDKTGSYSDKYEHIGRINYHLFPLDKHKIFLKKWGRLIKF